MIRLRRQYLKFEVQLSVPLVFPSPSSLLSLSLSLSRSLASSMGRLQARSHYEDVRNARVAENLAKLASLGLERSAEILKERFSPVKPFKTPKKYIKKVRDFTSVRRSSRLKDKSDPENGSVFSQLGRRRSSRLESKRTAIPIPDPQKEPLSDSFKKGKPLKARKEDGCEEVRPANAPLIYARPADLQLPDHVLARRCNSKERGSIYDPILGICCHFCRQKKLCGEDNCLRCGNRDVEQPCLGKTDCSICHSSQGVFCRACLKVRYGEDIDEVRKNRNWVCPHCIEAQGSKPYWICNSSFCLKKHNLAPTGIAIFRAREMGYKSVAHFLMDELRRNRKLA
ncbi:uncharacterized protein LOC116258807 [Nymphaea colorata]|nr:uncharacterized protein LOC116258807 [Nymphaea colorata]